MLHTTYHTGLAMGLKRRGIRSLAGTAAVLFLAAGPGQTQVPASRETAENAINEYCSDCHNAQVKTAGVVLDPAALAQPGNHAELLERVVRQLRAKSMPPVGNPRPDDATYQQFRPYLETELDRAAAAQPNPGELPNLHRLSRTEYRNA